jgi:hypothetical protein
MLSEDNKLDHDKQTGKLLYKYRHMCTHSLALSIYVAKRMAPQRLATRKATYVPRCHEEEPSTICNVHFLFIRRFDKTRQC